MGRRLTMYYGIIAQIIVFRQVGEKPDKELPGIVGARGDTV